MSFYGDNINRFFFGTVVNNNDADLFLGRVQIRVYGLHGEEIPNYDLPWAQTMLPSTEPGMGGVGSAPMISNGAQVFGVFLDGTDSQIPLVLGSIPKVMVPTSDQANAYTGARPSGGGGGADAGQSAAIYKGSATAIAPGSLEGSTNAEKVYRFLINNGFTPEQACGIVGNFAAESTANIDPNANNPNDKGKQSFGIAQWRDTRLNDLRNYASSTGQDYTTLECQLGFFMYELQTSEKKAATKLKASRTAAEAAANFDQHYERSDGTHRQKRISYAEDAYRRFVS
jgi:hypothetical protein